MSDELIDQFVRVTSASRNLAEQYLARNNNDIMDAIEDYYASTSRSPEPRAGGGVRTFRDLNEEPEDSTNNNFFTGGEKSALQVEDPNKKKDKPLIDQIFQRALEQSEQPDDRPSAQQQPKNKFLGTGFKLGDTESGSEKIVDPSELLPQKPEKVTREITFWRQGFTVGDGPLHRYDNPDNTLVLNELNRGRVPVSLLDVEFGQDVDVSVFRKTDEDYTPPKRKVGGFHGLGQRLGSPVPGEPVAEPAPAPAPQPTTQTPASKPDEGSGDSLVQIRFANGKRVAHRFNASDSVARVYEFVRTHEHTTPGRAFVLLHSFPVKPIEESDDTTVADAKLKNAVIVQRWT